MSTSLPPADRLLASATELFRTEGIRAVGVDRLLQSASAARASLYQQFGSKNGLIAAYLRRLDEVDRAAYNDAAQAMSVPQDRILLSFDLAARNAAANGFRGCAYLNASTEFPDRDHPATAVIRDHRAWVRAQWRNALTELGDHQPRRTAADLLVLYDGGLAGSKITHTTTPIRSARRMAEQLLTTVGPRH